MNQLMTHIQSVMTAVGLDNVDKRIYNQLQRVIDMRNNNWDNQGAAYMESQDHDGTNSVPSVRINYVDNVNILACKYILCKIQILFLFCIQWSLCISELSYDILFHNI